MSIQEIMESHGYKFSEDKNKNGLKQVTEDEVSILEIGFGTGLNSFITYLEAKKPIHYFQ